MDIKIFKVVTANQKLQKRHKLLTILLIGGTAIGGILANTWIESDFTKFAMFLVVASIWGVVYYQEHGGKWALPVGNMVVDFARKKIKVDDQIFLFQDLHKIEFVIKGYQKITYSLLEQDLKTTIGSHNRLTLVAKDGRSVDFYILLESKEELAEFQEAMERLEKALEQIEKLL